MKTLDFIVVLFQSNKIQDKKCWTKNPSRIKEYPRNAKHDVQRTTYGHCDEDAKVKQTDENRILCCTYAWICYIHEHRTHWGSIATLKKSNDTIN